MAKTILSLTEENKNYLLVFLGDYYNKCGNTINKTSQDKRQNFALQTGAGKRGMITSDSVSKIESRLSDIFNSHSGKS
jgi:hypothetical protein